MPNNLDGRPFVPGQGGSEVPLQQIFIEDIVLLYQRLIEAIGFGQRRNIGLCRFRRKHVLNRIAPAQTQDEEDGQSNQPKSNKPL